MQAVEGGMTAKGGSYMSHRTHILGWDALIPVNSPDDLETAARASRYTTLAVAAMRSQRKTITSMSGYVERTHTQACREDERKVNATASRWAGNVQGRAEWMPTVCDAMILGRAQQDDRSYVSIELDPNVRDAAQTLFGHSFGDECLRGGFTLCPICRLADSGDWESALRRVALDQYSTACAALVDGYKAARRAGLITKVEPKEDPWLSPRRPIVHAKRPLRDGEVEF